MPSRGGEAYHVDLATISPDKLEEGHIFVVIIKERRILTRGDGTQEFSYIKHQLPLHFKGTAYSTYELQRMESEDEEECLGGYEIVENTSNIAKNSSTSLFQSFLISVVCANENRSESLLVLDQASTSEAEESGNAELNVIYFERPADQGKVRAALSKAEIQYAIEKSASTKPVNAVWVGVDIPSDIAKRIGMSFLTEGIDLRYFGFFTYPGTKTNIVQIGYSQINADNRSITHNDILSFTGQLHDKQNFLQKQNQKHQKINEIIIERLQKIQQ